MRDNPGRGELDHAECVRRRFKKNSPYVLSCIGKRTREGCDRGSEILTIHTDETGIGPVSPEETEGIWQEREL